MRKTLSLVLPLLLTATIASADDSFYETRLASGKQAYVEKRMPDAVADLRIAAFGFLERPALLSETLVWLTLAETASKRPERIRWALTRFLEVETKFHPYRQLALDAPSRGAFEKILVATLSPDAIASIPTLAELVVPAARRGQAPSREPAKAAVRATPPPVAVIPVVPPPVKPQPTQPQPAPAQPAQPQPATATSQKVVSPTPAQQTSAARDPQSMPTVVPKKSTVTPSVPAAPVLSAEAQAAETIEKAKGLLGQNRNDEALRMLKDLVARTPSRTARKYLLHAATRTHNWQMAAAQVPQLEPFRTGEEVTMFYAAVALYQTGKLAEARPLLERSLPGVNPSPYVESYKQRILGH